MAVPGRKSILEEFCIPEATRLKRRCARYRALADRIRRNSAMPPECWLLSKDEALSLIGSTLHYGRHGKYCYDTLQSCSEDGAQIYSSRNACPHGLTPLSFLSLGFGKAL